MRNHIVDNALRNAESHLAHAPDSNLKSAIDQLLAAVKEMADNDEERSGQDDEEDWYEHPDTSDPRDYYVFIDEDSHVEAFYKYHADLRHAEYTATRDRCRAIAVATHAKLKVTRANPAGL